MMTNVGVIHGRFQPFHLDHLEYALAAYKRCDFLFIGITNPDVSEMVFQESDPSRSLDISNPLTFWERSLLIQASLLARDLSPDRFSIVPFPLHNTELLRAYVPLDARFYMTIYDDWGRHKRNLLRSLGLDVDVMWERPLAEKRITATTIRRRIAAGEAWEKLVPPVVAQMMKEMALDRRIRHVLHRNDGYSYQQGTRHSSPC
jgi:nicotinamide-nucleotide adenylyltransferase